jgi:hypothetical protein
MIVLGIVTAASSRGARANPVEIYGFGSAHAAEAGTGVATTDDFAAVYYNPAGLGAGHGKQASVGFLGALSNLHVEDRHADDASSMGVTLGIVVPAPLGGPLEGRLRVGIGMYLLPGGKQTVAEIVAHFPDEPFYPWYDGRVQRTVILPGAAVKIMNGLWVGGAINFLAGLDGALLASEGETRAIEARVDEGVPSIARIHAGVLWQPTPSIRAGATYRQRFDVPFATRANTQVAGEPIDLDLRASGEFTPNEIAIGGAWMSPRGHAALDVTWSNWSEYPGPFVIVESALPLVGPLAAALPEVPYHDTIAVRAGGEVAATDGILLRGGYGFETSPVPADQRGVTNLLDGPKHTVALGLGFSWKRADGKRVHLDLHLQAQLVGSRSLDKDIFDGTGEYDPFTSLRDEVIDEAGQPDTLGSQISNPGYPGLRSGGQVFSGGLTIGADL